MSNETNQDRQPPTQDQPPRKQYATGPTGQPGEHRTDERRPKVPDHVETEGSDDQRGKTSSGGASDRLPTNQGTNDNKSKQRGQSGQEGGSRSGQGGSSGSSRGSPTGSGSGRRPGGGKP